MDNIENKLIPEQRRSSILDFIKINKIVTLLEICNNFSISEMTARRDFKKDELVEL